jgi:hypothetical protein
MGFIQGSEVVKIGTSENLQARMRNLYIPMGNVLAVVPGSREVETGYHRLFAEYQVNHRMREMFRLEGHLKRFLGGQAEDSDLPACEPSLIQSASAHPEPATPVIPAGGDPRGVLVSIAEVIERGFAPRATVKALRQDRYRSDKGQLPEGLEFPEVAERNGQTERFWSSEITEFNAQRRWYASRGRASTKEHAS